MTQKHYEQLKKEIIKAKHSNDENARLLLSYAVFESDREVSFTLADVLIALDKKNKIQGLYISCGLLYMGEISENYLIWDLKNNSLDWHWENKKETVVFLYNLICK